MSTNDALALQQNFDLWKQKRFPSGPPKDLNIFEYYCINQFLRQFDLSDAQLKTGIVGNSGDGGIDALYMFINGELVDIETELDPKVTNRVKIVIMQIKEGEGFSPTAIDKMHFFSDDLFDLARPKADYNTNYHANLVSLMRMIKDKYAIIVGENPPLSVDYYYITKLDVPPNEDCEKPKSRVIKTVKSHFPHAHVEFQYVGASALWKQIQARPPKNKKLKWATQPMTTPEGEIGLVRLADYYEFIKEADGQIAERFFDSNVRGYWKSKPVNQAIGATLKNPATSAEFWLLNNGVTVITPSITAGQYLEVDIVDPQIVNGLQTSREIYNYFRDNPPKDGDNRRVQVRLIKAAETETAVRDSVIRSTNSQNVMPSEALRATDPIHRQIEQAFHVYQLFYDRRQGYYRDQGKPVAQIISMVELVQAMLTLVIRRPDDARGRPRNYVKDDNLYKHIFEKDKYSTAVYTKCVQVMRSVDDFMDTLELDTVSRRNLPHWVAMYAFSMASGNAHAPLSGSFDPKKVTPEHLKDAVNKVAKIYEKLAAKHGSGDDSIHDLLARGSGGFMLKAVNSELKKRLHSPKKKKVVASGN